MTDLRRPAGKVTTRSRVRRERRIRRPLHLLSPQASVSSLPLPAARSASCQLPESVVSAAMGESPSGPGSVAPDESAPLAAGGQRRHLLHDDRFPSLNRPLGESSVGGSSTRSPPVRDPRPDGGSSARNDGVSTGGGVVTIDALATGAERVRRRGGTGFRARWRYPREENANGGDSRCRRHQERAGAVVEGAHQPCDGRQKHRAAGIQEGLPGPSMLGRDGSVAGRVVRRGDARRGSLRPSAPATRA